MKEELENLLGQLQMQNQQLQTLILQKQALMVQEKEIDNALEEIEKSGDDVYRTVGPILVKTQKNAITKELQETKEEVALKLKAIQTQEKRLKERMKEGQDKFQNMLPRQAG